MSTETIIAPASHATVGKVPRGLLVGGLLAFTAAAMAVYWLRTDEPNVPTASADKVKEQLREAAKSDAKGRPEAVEEAVAAAREKQVRVERVAAAASAASAAAARDKPEPKLPFPRPEPGKPLPAPSYQGTPPALTTHSEPLPQMDPAQAERERASRESKVVVFDQSAGQASGASDVKVGARAGQGSMDATIRAMQAQAQELRDSIGAPGAGARPEDPLARLIAAQQGNQPQGRTGGQEAWLSNMRKTGANADVIVPNPPPAEYVLRQGRVIPATLTRELTSEAPGVVTARSSEDVYDANGRLLIPKGSQFVGRYNSNVAFGDSRMIAAFTRMYLPNGYTFELPGAEISDALGRGGMEGDVDRHFVRSFGSALLLGVLADRVSQQSKIPQGGAQGSGSLSATGQVFVDTAKIELDRNKAIAPTIPVPAGSRINVEVVKDMVFPGPYSSSSNSRWSR